MNKPKPQNWIREGSFHAKHERDKRRVEELKKDKELQERISKNVKKL